MKCRKCGEETFTEKSRCYLHIKRLDIRPGKKKKKTEEEDEEEETIETKEED